MATQLCGWYNSKTNLNVKFQFLCLLLVLGQVCLEMRYLVLLVTNGFVQRLEFLANPTVSLFL